MQYPARQQSVGATIDKIDFEKAPLFHYLEICWDNLVAVLTWSLHAFYLKSSYKIATDPNKLQHQPC